MWKTRKLEGKTRLLQKLLDPNCICIFLSCFLNITFTAFNYFFFSTGFLYVVFFFEKDHFLCSHWLERVSEVFFFLSGSEPVIALCHAHIYKETRSRADTYTAVFAHALCTMQHIITCCYSDGLGACQPAVGSNTSSGYTVLPSNTGSHTQSRWYPAGVGRLGFKADSWHSWFIFCEVYLSYSNM